MTLGATQSDLAKSHASRLSQPGSRVTGLHPESDPWDLTKNRAQERNQKQLQTVKYGIVFCGFG